MHRYFAARSAPRGRALAEMTTCLVARAWERAWRALEQRRRARRYRDLLALDDATLRDIGFTRIELFRRLDGPARRQGAGPPPNTDDPDPARRVRPPNQRRETMTRKPANPFESGRAYIADGGLETAMIFHEGFDLPLFASFTLLETEAGRAAMRRYFDHFIDAAAANGAGFLLDTPTWRAGGGWGEKLGRSAAEMDAAVRDAAAFCAEVKAARARPDLPVLINGVVGPAGDGYDPEELMTVASAAAYHRAQVESFVGTEVDLISAVTMTHAEEAIGVASLAQEFDFPFFLSFTVETDGRLPTGELLGRAIERTDEATGGAALFYMVNCAHPDHFPADLSSGADWTRRIGGVRPNASRQSHAELDEAETLDDGDPRELGRMCATLAGRLGGLKVMGGCCGTDHRHVEEMARNWSAHRRLAVA